MPRRWRLCLVVLPPAALSLDAMDASGSHQLDILHDVFKQRLDP